MDGKKVVEIGLRKNYGISIFLVKEQRSRKDSRMITPGSSYVLYEGDVMLVSGCGKAIEEIMEH
ncbi:cation:proton antiporter regulatory subunit [Candidatus Latescibacterota bacterium]